MNPTDYSMYCRYQYFLTEMLRRPQEEKITDFFKIGIFVPQDDDAVDDDQTLKLVFSGENPEAPAIVLAWSELANVVMPCIPLNLTNDEGFAPDDGFGVWPILSSDEDKRIASYIELPAPKEDMDEDELKEFVEQSLRDQLQDFLDTVEKFYFAPMRLIIDKAGESIDLFD